MAMPSHGRGQQLAFWNADQDERGFATMHINRVRSGTSVCAILRPARTPKTRGAARVASKKAAREAAFP
jgi:hypothetical protein